MLNRRTWLFASIVGLALLPIGGETKAQTGPARLVRDINTTSTSGSGSSPSDFVAFQGRAYFSAFSLETGRELWSSDGTDAGTVLLKDIAPGPAPSTPRNLRVVDGTLF